MKNMTHVIILSGFFCVASIALAVGAFNPCPTPPTPPSGCCNDSGPCPNVVAGCFKVGSLKNTICCQPITSVCGCAFTICQDPEFCPSGVHPNVNQYIINFVNPFTATPTVFVSSSDGASQCISVTKEFFVLQTSDGAFTCFVAAVLP